MKKNMINLAVAGVLGMGMASAHAADAYEGSWYLVPGVSYMHTDSKLDANNDMGGFIRLGKEISEHWDIQIGAGNARANEDLSVADASGRFRQTLVGVDALYMFSRDRFRPFLMAGLGVARNRIDYKVGDVGIGDSRTSPMANIGLGAQFMVTESLGLQADLRHVWSRARNDDDLRLGQMDFNGSRTVGNTYFNLGAIFKFGAPPKQVAAVEPEPVMVAPEPAPEPAPVPPKACKPQVERFLLSSEILFGFDKDKLKPEGIQMLDSEVIPKLKSELFEVVFVTGHTDMLGSFEYNDALSKRRADRVKEYLASQGIDTNIIIAHGAGESSPVVICDEKLPRKQLIECLQPNRRVEVEANRNEKTACE